MSERRENFCLETLLRSHKSCIIHGKKRFFSVVGFITVRSSPIKLIDLENALRQTDLCCHNCVYGICAKKLHLQRSEESAATVGCPAAPKCHQRPACPGQTKLQWKRPLLWSAGP